MSQDKKAVVLLSGGLDSATVLAIARDKGYACHALSFSYGQRHAHELTAAAELAADLGAAAHTIAEIDLSVFGGSALTADIDVPKHASVDEIGADIPVTYVPARNTIFLSYALGYAEVLGTGDIFIGINAMDYSGYPDCRPEYIKAFERMARLATKSGIEGTDIKIHAPLLFLSKAQIIKKGTRLAVDYGLTTSCYDPAEDGAACGHCDACLLRLKGFAEAGVADPACYQTIETA